MKYIVKYEKVPYENIYHIKISDGIIYEACTCDSAKGWFLQFSFFENDILFIKFNISKDRLLRKVFNRPYSSGRWPYCKTEKECITLLKALIKETQIQYYAKTEI